MSVNVKNPAPAAAEPDGVFYIPKHGHGRLKLWQPGQSANPSGRGGRFHEVQRMAKEAAPAVFEALIAIALNPEEDSRCRIIAGQEVLGRAFGRIPAAETKDQPTAAAAIDASRLSDRELETLGKLLEKPSTGAEE